jgi:hypothetical protein
MIPVINRYIACGYRIMLGGSGKSGELLKATFPCLPFISIPSPVIYYPGKAKWLISSLIWQLPKIFFSAIREHRLIKKIVIAHGVNIIVSDNRYGLFCRHTYSIFVTHQISPVLPAALRWAEYPLYRLIRFIIHHYDECWIPDFADRQHNLTGKLSHRYKLPVNARFVGILSRFNPTFVKKKEANPGKFKLVIVLSGPEPQLSIFSKLIIRQARSVPNKTLIITGLQENSNPKAVFADSPVTLVSHLEPLQFGQVLVQADMIVCRSGYSGIMDLVALGKTGMLVPTPGQSEQEYLACYLFNKGWFSYVTQHKLDLGVIMRNKEKSTVPEILFNFSRLEDLPIVPVSKDINC